jgi:hypothetical protein
MKYLILLLCVLSMNVNAGIFGPSFEELLVSDTTVIVLKFYDNVAQVEAACMVGAVGCALCNEDNSICTIHAVKERCVVAHEIDHVLFGAFHGDSKVNCKARGI